MHAISIGGVLAATRRKKCNLAAHARLARDRLNLGLDLHIAFSTRAHLLFSTKRYVLVKACWLQPLLFRTQITLKV